MSNSIDRLEKLDSLRKSGAITEIEFESYGDSALNKTASYPSYGDSALNKSYGDSALNKTASYR
jgi:hypothetical protein